MVLDLSKLVNTKKKGKRVGRGNASGHGTYSTRGQKGQRARSGGRGGLKLKGFKQNLLNMPKFKGMKSPRPKAQLIFISTLEKHFEIGEAVTPGVLLERGLVKSMDLPIKILVQSAEDNLTKKLEITDCAVSKSARALIEKAGGKIVESNGAMEQESNEA
jgi:large subunit ribosomal protein L15